MSTKTLFILESIKLFEILNEIKSYLNFKIQYVDRKSINEINLNSSDDYLIVSLESYNQYSNYINIDKLPRKINELIQMINLNFIKNQFVEKSNYKLGKYNLNLNSRVISFKNINLDLTEREIEMLLFINYNNKASLKMIQKNVWKHLLDLETHTVETHIYRLRKKIKDNFEDKNFLGFENGEYFLNQKK